MAIMKMNLIKITNQEISGPFVTRQDASHLVRSSRCTPFYLACSFGSLTLAFMTPLAQSQTTLTNGSGNAVSQLESITVKGLSRVLPTATEQATSYTVGQSRTATKLDLSPRETPQTMTVLTHEQLKDFRLNNANDALSAAGVGVQRVETDRTYFTSRGLDITNFQLDGIGMPFSSEEQMGDIDTFLYDHIEVLKGANGLTSNPGNPSATINFVRKRPTRDFRAEGSLSYGSYATRRAEADVSGALNKNGSVRGRLLAVGQKGNGSLDRYSQEKTIFSALIEADLTDKSTLSFGHSQQRNRPTGIMWSGLTLNYKDGSRIPYSRSYNTAPDWSYWNTDDKQSFAELKTNWGKGWISQLTANYRETSSDAEMMMIGLRGQAPDKLTGLGLSSYASKFDRSERQLLGDAFIKGPLTLFGRQHEVVLGTNWARTRAKWTSADDAIGLPTPPVGEFDGNFPRPAFAKVTSWANYSIYRSGIYAAGHFSLNDKLKLITGVNISNLRGTGNRVGDPHSYNKTKTTPYLGATYDLNETYSLYASYTGIFNPQYRINQAGALLAPIEGNNIEAGIKGEWLDGLLNASAALFRTRQKNTAEYAGFDTAGGFSYYRPVDTIIEGYDLTLAGRLSPGWELSAGLTHLFSLRDGDGQQTRSFIPKTTFFIASSYRPPQLSKLKVGTSIQWQSDIDRTQGLASNGSTIVSRQNAYAVVNAMASYQIDPQLTASLNINNVFDRKYLTSLYWAQSYYAPGRNATLALTWKY